jgi:hypothetical protein
VSGDRVVPSVVEAVCTEGSMADARVRITYGSSLSKPSVSSIIRHETGARWRLRRLRAKMSELSPVTGLPSQICWPRPGLATGV